MDIRKEKELLTKKLEEINANISKEDIKKLSRKELLEFAKVNLEIQKNLTILQAAEDAGII
ncbi:MAG: hypothetical protein IJB90_05425 [Clostridia bacterium]|nr:hypothetical protein [Clostridia bacterium]